MKIPVYVAVAQWALLLALGVLVTLMFRQLGRHLSGTRTASGLGPRVGSPAREFGYLRLDGAADESLRPGDGQATLLAFVDPTCPSCEELVAAMNAADAAGELTHVRSLLLISEPPSYLQISEPFRQTQLPVGRVLADSTLADYGVSATPLLVAVDRAGVVRAAGPATRRVDVQAFVRACLLPVPDATLPVLPAAGDRVTS